MVPPKTLARIAGLLYLIGALGPLFAESVRSAVVGGTSIGEPGGAAATADSIRASATLFRLSFVGELVAAIPWLLMAMALYLLLKHVSQPVAATMVLFLAVGTAVGSLNLLNQYTALTIATGDAYTRAFGQAGADALTMLFTDMHRNGFILNATFYGPWLAPLGYLVIRSGYFPKPLGVLLIVGGFGYLAVLLTTFLAPDAPAGVRTFLTTVGGVPELVFMAWLLVKGVRVTAGRLPAPA